LPLGSSSITAAVALVDRDMLTRMWDQMDYRIDVCRITEGGHIENKKLGEIICIIYYCFSFNVSRTYE
jgi:hypothetical protein